MKFSILKIAFCILFMLVISTTSWAAVTNTDRIVDSAIRQTSSYSRQSMMSLPAGGSITDRLRSEVFSQPATAAQGTVAHDIQTTGNGITTILAALIGFLCVSLVRDRRTWVAAVYIVLIHPVVLEAQHLDRLVRHAHIDKYVTRTAELYPWHSCTLNIQNRFREPSGLDHAVAFYCRTPIRFGQWQSVEFTLTDGLVYYDSPQIYLIINNAPSHSGRFFTCNIFSRPPPA